MDILYFQQVGSRVSIRSMKSSISLFSSGQDQ